MKYSFLFSMLLILQPSAAAVDDKPLPASCRDGVPSGKPLIPGKAVPANRPSLPSPPKGMWYADPLYGACVVRVTDHEKEPPQGFARNDYSRRQPFNSDESLLLVYAQNGYWHLYDADTLEYLRKLDLGGGSVEPQWHPRDPDRLFVLPNNGGMHLDIVNVRNGERTVVADFSDGLQIAGHPDADALTDLWPSAARVTTRSEGSPSRNARYWAFEVETRDFQPLGMITYDLEKNTVLGVYDFETDGDGIGRPDHLSISPSGRYVVASWNGKDVNCPSRLLLGSRDNPCGLMSFTQDFSKAIGLATRGPHSDIALKRDGEEVIVISNYVTGNVEMKTLDDGDTTTLWRIYEDGFSTAMHISGKAYEKPGWVLISTYSMHARKPGTPWYTDKIMAVELADDPRIVNIANTYNVRKRYFSEPHAVVNRDFSRIVFNSNWETGNDTDIDVYMVKLPANAIH